MIAEHIPQIQDLSTDEKVILLSELWDQISGSTETEPPTAELLEAIRERMEFNDAHPELHSSWEDVRARILSRDA